MSNWCYVTGSVRVRGERDWDEVFGKECLWESPEEVWDDRKKHPDDYMPMGSEGSLHKSVVHHDEGYTVSIGGNLRDVWGVEDIELWFSECCHELEPEQAVCEIDCGYMGYRLLTWNGERVVSRKERE